MIFKKKTRVRNLKNGHGMQMIQSMKTLENMFLHLRAADIKIVMEKGILTLTKKIMSQLIMQRLHTKLVNLQKYSINYNRSLRDMLNVTQVGIIYQNLLLCNRYIKCFYKLSRSNLNWIRSFYFDIII